MWIKYKNKGNLAFINLEKAECVTLVTGSNEQCVVVEFADRVCKINEFENENFEEIKAKLMSWDNENYNEEQAGIKLMSSTLDSLHD